MTSSANRAAVLTKAHKVLKKHYEPQEAPSDRSVLEHMIYACCLENSHYEAADEAYAHLQESYYDLNEVRVTTITELSETLRSLPSPQAAATNLKKVLQTVFESQYSFDIDVLRKQNLGKSVKEIERYAPNSPFVVAYTTQSGFGGHSIPLSLGAMMALQVIGAATESDIPKHRVPGLERTISKTKGVEFGSLLHQLGADCFASMFAPAVRSVLLEIAPDAKERLPKRKAKKAAPAPTKKAANATKPANVTKKAKEKAKIPTKKTGTKKLAKKKPR